MPTSSLVSTERGTAGAALSTQQLFGNFSVHAFDDTRVIVTLVRTRLTVENACLVVAACAVLCNLVLSLSVSTLLRRRVLSCKRFSFVLSLSLSDLALCSLRVVGAALLLLGLSRRYGGQWWRVVLSSGLYWAPVLNYTGLCVIQWVAVRSPLLYSIQVSRELCWKFLLCGWLAVLLLGVLFGYVLPMRVCQQDADCKVAVGLAMDCLTLSLFYLNIVLYFVVVFSVLRKRARKPRRWLRRLALHLIVCVLCCIPLLSVSCALSIMSLYGYKQLALKLTDISLYLMPLFLSRAIWDPLVYIATEKHLWDFLCCRPVVIFSRSSGNRKLLHSEQLSQQRTSC